MRSYGFPTMVNLDSLRRGHKLFPEDAAGTEAYPSGVILDVTCDRGSAAYVIRLMDGRVFTYAFGRRAFVASPY